MERFNLRVYYGDAHSLSIDAESYENSDGHLTFYNEDSDIIASYPSAITAIVSVEIIEDNFF